MSVFLITGGAGFIGSNLCDELLKRGKKVRVIDNLSTGKMENLSRVIKEIEFIQGDLRNIDDLRKAVKGVDTVFHIGAIPSVTRSVKDPITSNEANVDGTLNLLVASKEAGVRRLVYSGSSSAYGDKIELLKSEELSPEPLSPYAVSKLTGEYYCSVFSKLYGIETVVLRYFNVFGPRQDPSSPYSGVISIFIRQMISGEKPTVYGDGEQSRDFTFVKNVVNANIAASERQGISGSLINVACGKRITLNELIDELNIILGTNLQPLYFEPRAGDIKHSLADITRANKFLDYSPEVSFSDGLNKTVEWYRREYCK
ncbi:MAG: SDR family oxidoreductase [Candidatus Schekmanbacteria bacterium]|nr:SDR family oxidoreductase [Candidatus Schekmanbacteria bacterium]